MRGQTMVGYQFEHDFSNGLTFRQNARYAHVDVNINSYIGPATVVVAGKRDAAALSLSYEQLGRPRDHR